jgi:hypothetical protein
MNLGQFKTRVQRAIRRGNSLDDVIPYWIADAAQQIEQNYTFSWMRRNGTFTILSSSETPNQLSFPNSRVKSFEWIKVAQTQGDGESVLYGELLGVEPRRVSALMRGPISGYWLDGLSYIYFDNYVEEDTNFLLRWNEFTDWPIDDDDAEPSLLTRGSTLLFAVTMQFFAGEMRDARMFEVYGNLASSSVSTLLRSEEELKMQHQNDLVMRPA